MRTDTSIIHWSAGGAAGDLSQSLVGEAVEVTNGRIAFAFVWTGGAAPTGTLSFQVSQNKVDWFPLPGSFTPTLTGPAGVADSSACDGIQSDMRFMRPIYTWGAGGAGDTITCTVSRPQ